MRPEGSVEKVSAIRQLVIPGKDGAFRRVYYKQKRNSTYVLNVVAVNLSRIVSFSLVWRV